jgi:hypothetical protein
MEDIVAWFRSALSGLGDWPSLPPDISPLYLALGCIVAGFLFLFVLTVLIQRRRRRLQINQFASLHSEIDQLKYRILALEVTERRRQKDALRNRGETQEVPEKNVLTLFAPLSTDEPPLQPNAASPAASAVRGR